MRQNALKKHVLDAHVNFTRYACDICERKYLDIESFKYSVRVEKACLKWLCVLIF